MKLQSIPFLRVMPIPHFSQVWIAVNVPGQHICSGFNRLGFHVFVAKCMPGQHVFCDLGGTTSKREELMASRSSVEFSCGMY